MPELSLEPTVASSLTKLDCGTLGLDSSSFDNVARLPRLQFLSCALPANPHGLREDSNLFPALREFHITVVMLQHLTAVSHVITLERVETVHLTVREAAEPALLFIAIRKLLSPSVLIDLRVSVAPIPGHPEGSAVRPSHLRPLLDLKAIQFFAIVCHCHLRLDNQFCADMAQAWPRITKLSLRSTIESINDIHGLPNLQGLVPFAIHCPDLLSLEIQFNASDGRSLSLPRRSNRSCLIWLTIPHCPISHPDHVSALIARLFPRVRIFSCIVAGNQAAWKKDWEEVQRYLPLFADIRNDEREWVENERIEH